MATIEVNGIPIHHERTGQGPGVLMVHGMCGDADVFADQARRLSDRAACVRYDRRGHSRSPRGDAPISSALHADDAAALIDALGLAPCLLVASSGGAAIGVDVARRHGHLLRGAVLSEPPLFSLDPVAGEAFMRELVPRVDQALAEGGERAAVDAFFSFVCPGLWSGLDDARRDRYRANAGIGLAELRAGSPHVSPSELRDVHVPTLVISGERSHPSFRVVARRLAAELPDSRLVELSGSGHVTYAERPRAVADAVSTFVAELDRRAATGTPRSAR